MSMKYINIFLKVTIPKPLYFSNLIIIKYILSTYINKNKHKAFAIIYYNTADYTKELYLNRSSN